MTKVIIITPQRTAKIMRSFLSNGRLVATLSFNLCPLASLELMPLEHRQKNRFSLNGLCLF